MSRSIHWRRVLIEGVVIVGSILLAFAIDAWWDERQERSLTDRRIEALLSEFEQARAEIESEIRGVRSSYEGSTAVLAMFRAPRSERSAEELAAQVIKSFNVGVFTVQHPVLTMMITSGELLEAEDDELLALIAVWQDQIEHLRMDSQDLESNRNQMIFGRAVEVGIPIGDHGDPRILALLDDPGMEAAFLFRAGRAERLDTAYSEALETAGQITDRLNHVWRKAQ